MKPIEKIRRNVFRMRQNAFAAEIGVAQSSIHRWEKGTPVSSDNMMAIRDAATRLGIAWDDRWFFNADLIPEIDQAGAAENA